MNDFFNRMYKAMEQIVNEEEQNKQNQTYQNQSYQNNTFYNQKPQKPTEDYKKQEFFNPSDTRRNDNYFNNNFINQDFFNPNDMRSDGNKTHRWDLDKPNTNFKKTSYGRKDEGFHTLANGVPYNDKNVKLNGNNYQYYDEETKQYYDIYALGMNQLKEHGHHKNKNVNVWDNDIYGSLIEVTHEDGSKTKGIVMDASSAGNKKAIIDQWTENVNPNNEMVTWEFKRKGWGTTKNPKR